jgi:hypothetical protein
MVEAFFYFYVRFFKGLNADTITNQNETIPRFSKARFRKRKRKRR